VGGGADRKVYPSTNQSTNNSQSPRRGLEFAKPPLEAREFRINWGEWRERKRMLAFGPVKKPVKEGGIGKKGRGGGSHGDYHIRCLIKGDCAGDF